MKEEHATYLQDMNAEEVRDMLKAIATQDWWPTLDGEDIDPLCVLALTAGMISRTDKILSLVIAYGIGHIQAKINELFVDLHDCKEAVERGDLDLATHKMQEMWDALEAWNGEALIAQV